MKEKFPITVVVDSHVGGKIEILRILIQFPCNLT